MTRATSRRLRRDTGRSLSIEFAFALPILATMMIGILQFSLVLHANGAMRHALGEGIRLAKVYPDADTDAVEEEVRGALAGISAEGIQDIEFERGISSGAAFGKVTMRYRLEPVIPFVPMPEIVLEEERQAWLPTGGTGGSTL